MLPASFTRRDLEAAGFVGWRTWDELRATDFRDVPCTPGVYVVYRESTAKPEFVCPGTGGQFKRNCPAVSRARLQEEWVEGAALLYIGKAALRRRRQKVEGLRRRLREYGRFGAREAVPHWGGRLIWQLADSAELLVAWREIPGPGAAREYERRLLRHFVELHRDRPFANLTG